MIRGPTVLHQRATCYFTIAPTDFVSHCDTCGRVKCAGTELVEVKGHMRCLHCHPDDEFWSWSKERWPNACTGALLSCL